MAENREEILANFQGITNIEDVAEAIFHLEETNWDLLSAINRVMPQEGNSSVSQSTDTHDVEMIDDDISVITPKTHPPDREDNNIASTSSPRNNVPNLVELQVHYNNKIHEIKMSGLATVSDLKKRLEMVCGVPVCRQQISGLGGSRATASAPLSTLGLPRDAVLRLKAADTVMADDEVAERLTTTYTLRVRHGERDYPLNYPGTKTVREVKGDLYSLTDIPVRHQVWTGWPSVQGLDDTVLAMVGLELPQHELTVRRAAPAKQKEYKRIVVESSDSENSSVEEVEDADFPVEEDMFVDVPAERLQPLMSENVEDEALGCIEFAQRFKQRYGPNTPNFFEGTLQDAIKESCLKPAKERRLLGVYLHHERSVLSNVFCAQLLGCDAVLHALADGFLLYGWDMTDSRNGDLLLTSVATALGPVASMTIRSIPVDRLPALVIIMRVRSNTEIYSVINGNVGVSELVAGLAEAAERFAARRAEDARVERERDARQRVKREQDEAYQRSLEVDRYVDTARAGPSWWRAWRKRRSGSRRGGRERDARQRVKREQDEAYQRSLEVDRYVDTARAGPSWWRAWRKRRSGSRRGGRERDARQRVKREQDEAYQRSLEVDRYVDTARAGPSWWRAWRKRRSGSRRGGRERDARQRVKREQDEAYQRSLEVDRAKEEFKKQQELERNQEIERAESERQEEEAKKEAMRAGAEARLPEEPAAGADAARIRVRLPPPHHECIERRFSPADPLAALLDFLASKGYPKENYKVISSWPRRDLTAEPHTSTLQALKLYPQETIMLEER